MRKVVVPISIVLLAVSSGCASKGARTAFNSITYPPTRGEIDSNVKKTNARILIEVADKRTEKSVWTFPCAMFLSWVPLVPCCPYKLEDVLTGSPYSLDSEMARAAQSHFDHNGLAKGTLLKNDNFDYRMVISINYCADKGCWTLYGGGIFPLGCWFAILGAPFKYGSNLIDADVSVYDRAGKEIYKKHFYENTFYCSGEYYNANILTFLGTGVCKMLNEVSHDLSGIIE